jgi:hypothetical protein
MKCVDCLASAISREIRWRVIKNKISTILNFIYHICPNDDLYSTPQSMKTGIHRKFILLHFFNLISHYPILHITRYRLLLRPTGYRTIFVGKINFSQDLAIDNAVSGKLPTLKKNLVFIIIFILFCIKIYPYNQFNILFFYFFLIFFYFLLKINRL